MLMLAMTILLVSEWLEVEVTLFSTLILLIAGEVITLEKAFSGFSNPGVLTIAMMFIMAGALNNTGILRQINHIFFGREQSHISRTQLRILFPVAALSAFINNTPVVALLIPAVRSWAERYNRALSKYLMPISFAAILGGMCTLIGTSTNLIIHGMMIEAGMPGLGLFEISIVGVPLAIAGLLLLAMFGHRFLPDRKAPMVEIGEQTREFVSEFKVIAGFEFVGKTIEEAGLRHLKGLFLFQIERDGEVIAPAEPNEKILIDDRLYFTGIPKTILELQQMPGLQLTRDSHFDLKNYDSADIKTFEAVLSNASPLLGKTVRDSNFRSQYEAVIIAIHRHGERIEKKIGDIVLKAGDTLLLLAGRNFREKWYHTNAFYLIAGSTSMPTKPQWRGYLTLSAFFIMMVLTVSGLLPLISAAGITVAFLLVTKTIRLHEAQRSLNWRVLLAVAMSLGIATAVKDSGVADAMAHLIVDAGNQFGTLGVMTSIYLMTSIYTVIITNNAAAAILFPIAISAAAEIGADPRAFAIVVMIAAAASFATPISYQTNLMVYGPGGYKFKDFLKIGVPLQAIIGVLALILISLIYM